MKPYEAPKGVEGLGETGFQDSEPQVRGWCLPASRSRSKLRAAVSSSRCSATARRKFIIVIELNPARGV